MESGSNQLLTLLNNCLRRVKSRVLKAGMLISYYGGSRRKGMNKKSDAYKGKKDAFRFLIKAGIAKGKWVNGDELTDPEWVIELVKCQ